MVVLNYIGYIIQHHTKPCKTKELIKKNCEKTEGVTSEEIRQIFKKIKETKE